jgi:hypothetical protein
MDTQDIEDDYEYLMEAISVLPDLTTLNLIVMSDGHCFGDSSLHVLRICTGIRKLVLELSSFPEFEVNICFAYLRLSPAS